jgi:hypothetical protein
VYVPAVGAPVKRTSLNAIFSRMDLTVGMVIKNKVFENKCIKPQPEIAITRIAGCNN